MCPEVYREALRVLSRLDAAYGADRDVEKDDGGFILVVEKVCDLCQVEQMGLKLDGFGHETLDVFQSEQGPYANILFLCNNEFGINVILPMRMAPRGLVQELEQKGQKKNEDRREGR